LLAAFAAGLAIGLAWYVAGYEVGGSQFLHWQLAMNLWSRFVPADAGGASYCANPFWYFAPHIATGFLPWSVFIPALAVAMWPRRARALPEPIVYALCWFAAIFIFFSLSRGKCLVYILPAFPPLAVLIGWLIDDAIDAASATALERLLFAAGGVVTAAGAIVIVALAIGLIMFGVPGGVAARLHPTDRRFLDIFGAMASRRAPTLIAWMTAFVAGAGLALAGVVGRRSAQIACGTAVIAAAGSIFWFGAINPQLAIEETLAGFARAVAERVPADAQIGHIGIEDCDLYFYSRRPIEPVSRFRCDAEPPFPAYIVIRRARFDAMAPAQRACLAPIMESAPVDSNGTRILVEQRPRPH
jgi:4-amino-4-deoxy-L-arabinose transferase-like glycosyltransferase